MPLASTTPDHQNSAKQKVEQKLVKIAGRQFDVATTEYTGTLFSVKYQGQHGWLVCKIGPIACLGVIPKPQIGAEYKLTGEWELNPRNKDEWQFKFKSYECTIDASKGLKELLVRECKWIGPSQAVRLVTTFRNETLQILRQDTEEDTKKLLAIPGITEHIAADIKEWARQEKSTAALKEKLYGIGLLPAQVDRLINAYGQQSEKKLREDCFAITEIKGFGFKTAAKIADLLGIPTNNPGRIRAAIQYQLDEMCQQYGHCCIVVSELIASVGKLCGVQQSVIEPIMEKMVLNEELLTNKTDWKKYAESQGIILPN